jgi:hypothetical protein
MEYIGMDVHLYTSTLHILDGHGGDVQTITIKGHWLKTVAWLRENGDGYSRSATRPRPAMALCTMS